jgi:hypothetical protein
MPQVGRIRHQKGNAKRTAAIAKHHKGQPSQPAAAAKMIPSASSIIPPADGKLTKCYLFAAHNQLQRSVVLCSFRAS